MEVQRTHIGWSILMFDREKYITIMMNWLPATATDSGVKKFKSMLENMSDSELYNWAQWDKPAKLKYRGEEGCL